MTPAFVGCTAAVVPPTISAEPADAPAPPQKIEPPKKTRNTNPVYPAEAQRQNIQGVVVLEARITRTGCVGSARVVHSIPMLDIAAMRAVLDWEYTPTHLNGVPVPVIMTVTVYFHLS